MIWEIIKKQGIVFMRNKQQLFLLLMLPITLISILIMPRLQWQQIISEIFSSSFYFQYWQLATDSVDYLAQNNEASPP